MKKILILKLIGHLIECLDEIVKDTDNQLDDRVVSAARDIHNTVEKVL